jgi:uncharacterized cupredoxin-like copper-binding protein
VVGLAVAGVAVVAFAVAGTRTAEAEPVLGPGPVTVDVRIEHSHFTPSVIKVREGTTVTFRVRNTDPIGHELIVGGPEVHARHESGHEATHPPVPGEVSIPALSTAETTFAFDPHGAPTVVFACHLPGHFAYGMRGEVRVLPAGAGG